MDDNLPKDQEQKVDEELSKLEQELDNLDKQVVNEPKPQEPVSTQTTGVSETMPQPEVSQEPVEPLKTGAPLPDFSQQESPQTTQQSGVQIPPTEPVSTAQPKYSTETVEVTEEPEEKWQAQPQAVGHQASQPELVMPEPQVQTPPQEQVQTQEPVQQPAQEPEHQPAYMNVPPDDQTTQPDQQPQQQVQQEQQIHQKGESDGGKKTKIIMWVGIGLLVLALVVAGGYYFFLSSEGSAEPTPVPTPVVTPSPTPTPTTDPTAGWEVYKGVGYSVKYPAEFEQFDYKEGTSSGVLLTYLGPNQDSPESELSDGVIVKTITIKGVSTPIDEYAEVRRDDELKKPGIEASSVKNTTIDGKTAYYYTYSGKASGKSLYIQTDGDILRINGLYAGTPEDIVLYEQKSDRVINTLIFVDNKSIGASEDCVVSGCNNEICAEEEMSSTCEVKPEYACYSDAVCETQTDGKCGWTQTSALQLCLQENSSTE